ncbi:hypothetical protein P9112_009746 [Eukaryota sp. TZLM1-RC]
MSTALQKIAEIEAEIARTQKNKATNSHIGLLKAKIAKLKTEALLDEGSKKGGGGGRGFEVERTGDRRIALVGFPSVGKSSLLNTITTTKSDVSEQEFTTLTCIPGNLRHKGVHIQVLDLPGIIEGAKDGKGRGKQVIATARTSDLILVVLDATKPWTHKRIIEKELRGMGIRFNCTPPDIRIKKKEKGGICITSTVQLTKLTDDVINAVCKEYKLNNVELNFHTNADTDELIDAIEGNRVYLPIVYALNKIDSITIEELDLWDKIPHYVPISVHKGWNLDELKDEIWESLELTRVYTKPRGQPIDFDEPVVLTRRKGPTTVKRFIEAIHKQLASSVKYAWVWGKSVKFQPQRVGLSHELMDEDICQFVS